MSLPALLRTPRTLKLALRRFDRTWDELHGEVDIDELLITSTLRVAAPETFNFLTAHSGELRTVSAPPSGYGHGPDRGRQEAQETLRVAWQALVDARHPQLDDAATLVAKLFPQATSALSVRPLHEHD